MSGLHGFQRWAALAIGIGACLVPYRLAVAANCYWDAGGGTDKDWSTAANWDSAEPTAADNAFVGHASYTVCATAEITQASESCYALYLPDQFSGGYKVGRLEVKPGSQLTVMGGDSSWNWLNVGGGTYTGILIQSGGRVDCTNRLQIRGCGEYQLNAGELTVLGYRNGEYEDGGLFVQQPGTTNLALGGIGMYKTGAHIMSGGVFRTPSMYMANSAVFRQDGGTSVVGLMQMSTTNGQLLLRGGEMTVTNYNDTTDVSGTMEVGQGATLICVDRFWLGRGGVHTLLLLKGGVVNGAAYFRYPFNLSSGDRATVQGWGSVNLSGEYNMTGRTIADGFGTNRTLAITNFSRVGQWYENGTEGTNGWFAQNKGRLQLKMGINGSVMRWGAGVQGDESYWDFVNSVRFDLASPSGSGCIGSLYAANHSDVPAMSGSSKPVGIWRFETNGLSFASAVATFRFDQAQAGALGIENDLKVYSHSVGGGMWAAVSTQALNTASNLIVASNLTELAWFAVGKDISSSVGGTLFQME